MSLVSGIVPWKYNPKEHFSDFFVRTGEIAERIQNLPTKFRCMNGCAIKNVVVGDGTVNIEKTRSLLNPNYLFIGQIRASAEDSSMRRNNSRTTIFVRREGEII